MTDKKNTDALRRAQGGDTDAAARAIVGGARSGNDSIVLQAVEAAVGSLDTDVLDTILYAVSEEIASREIDRGAGRETYKAGTLHMPELGNVSLGRLVHEVVEFVEKLQSGDKSAGALMRDKHSGWNWRTRTTRTTSKSAQITNAKKALEKSQGIMVGCSSGLRIYALKPADPEKAKKKLDKRTKDIETRIKQMERTKANTEKQLEEFKARMVTVEKERAATLKRLEKEKKDIEKEKGDL